MTSLKANSLKRKKFQRGAAGEVFLIRKIDAGINPVLYYLSDVMNHPIQGGFYKEQLFLAPKPSLDLNFFQVENVIFTRKFKGKTYYFVKFKSYPEKFNKFVTYDELKQLE